MDAKRQKVRKTIIFISFLLFPVTMNYLSPYLIIDGSINGVVVGSFIVFAALFLGSLIFGRTFCSWICPAAGLQESCFTMNNTKVKGKLVNKIKYYIWSLWILAIITSAIIAGGYKTVNPFYLTETGISIDASQKYITYYVVVIIFLAITLSLGKRGACHSICWMAPFMVIGGKLGRFLWLPSLHLIAEKDKCSKCRVCESKCPMSLAVMDKVNKGDMVDNECILCGECVDGCIKKAIKYTFRK